MLASKYADPEAVKAEKSKRKSSRPSLDLGPGQDLMDSKYAPNPSPALQDATNNATTSLRSSSGVAKPPPFPSDNDASRRNGLPESNSPSEKNAPNASNTSKELPPLPKSNDTMDSPSLPKPPIILKSSPGSASEMEQSKQATVPVTDKSEPAATNPPPDSEPLPKSITPSLTSGLKARRSKAGKPCAIRLPTDRSKTYSGYPIPMSREEVKARLEKFESDGFDTRGFGLAKSTSVFDEDAMVAQARREYPDPNDKEQEHRQRDFSVAIPDKATWDEYVNRLTEEKLRALGVTTAEEEPAPSLSRHASSPFIPNTISPPVPSSSSASQHVWQNNATFSAPFSPAASTNNTSIGPVMSPGPQLGPQGFPSLMPRQPMFSFGMPSPQAQAPYQQFQFAGHQMSNSNSPIGRLSPAAPAMLSRAQSDFSHASQDAGEGRQTTPRNNSKPLSRANSAPYWRSNIQREEAQALDQGDIFKESQQDDSFADVASPKPQGHRHNISANLEREAEQYYPGEYVNEDAETAKGSEGEEGIRAETHRPKPSHASNASTSSRLNVAAKEFKFNPEASTTRNFSMPQEIFMPSPNKMARTSTATSSVQLTTAHSHQGSVSLSNLNVAAPEFKPPAQKNFAFSSSWFNFSAKKPSETAKSPPAETEEKERPSTIGSKIFGNIADIVKPTKKSKAVPIVDPNEVSQKEDESDPEDEDGRIIQSDDRRKKSRFGASDADDVPRFAEPTPEPESELSSQLPVETNRDASPAATTAAAAAASSPATASLAAPSSPLEDQVQELKSSAKRFALDDEMDMVGTLSDGSNVPWHDLGSDTRQDHQEPPSSEPTQDLLTSPIPASGFGASPRVRDASGLSPVPPTKSHMEQTSDGPAEGDSSLYPSFKEIDAVMDYINQDNSDFGVEAEKIERAEDLIPTSLQPQSAVRQPEQSSRGRALETAEQMDFDNDYEARPDIHELSAPQPHFSPVRKLNRMAEGPVSDWDDMLASGEELKLPQQTQFSDAHMASLVEGLLRRYLAPFEKQLKELSTSVKKPSARDLAGSRPISSYEKTDSDADDEDDSDKESRLQARDTRSDKRMEQIRSVIKEAIASSQSDGLGQIEQEVQFRKAAENRADDLQRHMFTSQNEISALKESARLSDERVRSLESERDEIKLRHRTVEEELRTKTLDFTTEVASLERTLDEYRTSSSKWQDELDSVKETRHLLQENIDKLKSEVTQSSQDKHQLQEKVDKLEGELSNSGNQYATERSAWEGNMDKHSQELEDLVETRDRLQKEVDDLMAQAEEHFQEQAQLKENVASLEREHSQERAQLKENIASLERESSQERAQLKENIASLESANSQGRTQLNERIASLEKELSEEQTQFTEKIASLEKGFSEEERQFREQVTLVEKEKSQEQAQLKEKITFLENQKTQEQAQLKEQFTSLEKEKTQEQTQLKEMITSLEKQHSQEQALLKEKITSLEKDLLQSKSWLETERTSFEAHNDKQTRKIEHSEQSRHSLQKTIDELKSEAAEASQQRTKLNERLSKVQDELTESKNQANSERSSREINKEKYVRRIENLQDKLKEATKNKERLDEEISRLGSIEKNSIKTSVMLEETQNARRKLEVMVNKLQEKTIEHQTIVARYEREASEAHENTSVQVERTKALMQADVEVANKRVENVRADLETRLDMTKSELDNVRKDHDAVRARYERFLNESSLSRKEAVQEAATTHNKRLEEERERFEKNLNELSSQHDRAIRNAIEDKQRSETHLNNSLKLANDKVAHLEEKNENLGERLSVAQSAAQAAAIAAQTAKQQQTSESRSITSTAISTPAHLEKVSPQALRESIVVLQEQLQERESRIEQLEGQVSSAGPDAPAKLKEREAEVGWLREVLGVRIDDLSDLVNNLQMEKFDRGAARNAAIRIKANLQMEQQEKDRTLQGGKQSESPSGSIRSLTDIQNFASPKAQQLSSAFSNWRKSSASPAFAGIRVALNSAPPSRPPPRGRSSEKASRESATAESANKEQQADTGLQNPLASAAAANANKQQPFQTGLMTPPASNLRRTPSTGADTITKKDGASKVTPKEPAEPQTPIRSRPSTGNRRRSDAPPFNGSPGTPELTSNREYDLDAELGSAALDFEGSAQGDKEDSMEETAARTQLQPLGEVVATPAAE